MATYTFVPNSTAPIVNWDDPTVWAGMVVPDAADSDVVFPLTTVPSTGNVFISTVNINPAESFVARSLNVMDANLDINGSLAVSGAISLDENSEINLDGGNLSFGSLISEGEGISGSGSVTTLGTLINTTEIEGDGLTVTAASLLNTGTLVAGEDGPLTITLTNGNAGSGFANGILTGGTYQMLQGGTLSLNVGAVITAIGATVEVDGSGMPSGSGDIESYDPATASMLPLEQTLRTILPSGELIVHDDGYATTQDLTNNGTISLQDGTLATPGLTIAASGHVSGFGSLAGPVQNNGFIQAGSSATGGGGGGLTLLLSGSVNGTGELSIAPDLNNSMAVLELAGSDTQTVKFGDGTGTLVLDNPAGFSGTIAVTPTTALSGPESYGMIYTDTFNDTVILGGIAFSSVTSTSFAPTATGGTLTINAGATSQMLTFAGSNLSLASFALSAGPQALSTSPPSLSIVVTEAAGTTPAALSLEMPPAPINGLSSVAATSLDLATLLGQGYKMQFISGTEALQLTNGTLSIGPDTTPALVQRLYEGLLGRPGDTAGLEGFNAMLVNGGNPASVAASMIGSSEYQAQHGTPAAQTDTQFVTSLYQGFLSRAPDAAGLTGWMNDLAQGTSRGQVAADFAQSAEAKTNLASTTTNVWVPNPQGGLVTELYETGLGRAPDLPSLHAWEQQLGAGLTPQQLAQAIAASPEFAADHAGSSSAAYVASLYQDGLGRTPSASELQGWVGQLQAGAGSTNVLYGIATSSEAGNHLLPAV